MIVWVDPNASIEVAEETKAQFCAFVFAVAVAGVETQFCASTLSAC
jgi:hypothetical protein